MGLTVAPAMTNPVRFTKVSPASFAQHRQPVDWNASKNQRGTDPFTHTTYPTAARNGPTGMAMSPASWGVRADTLISTQRIFVPGATKMHHALSAIQAAQQTTPDLPGPQLCSEATLAQA